MRMVHVSNPYIPALKIYGLQIVKMCEAFAGEGLRCAYFAQFRHVRRIKPLDIAYKTFRIYGERYCLLKNKFTVLSSIEISKMRDLFLR